MRPDLELVQIRRGESFTAWAHGYPYHTVRWHFHPEYELHQIVETRGRCFVGDFIGEFEPGNLVLTGPNLPHNWVSDVAEGTTVPLRCRIIQFSECFIGDAAKVLPELGALQPILEASRRGLLFSAETGREVRPLMEEMMEAQGVRRIELFMLIMGTISRAQGARSLASPNYLPDPSGYMSVGLNKALAFIREMKSRGACFALDDFGAGLASFGYLKLFPVDYVKIDGSFVRHMLEDVQSRVIVESIQRIAAATGLQTVAEWVENQAMLALLATMGIDFAQGYGTGKPVDIAQWSLAAATT